MDKSKYMKDTKDEIEDGQIEDNELLDIKISHSQMSRSSYTGDNREENNDYTMYQETPGHLPKV